MKTQSVAGKPRRRGRSHRAALARPRVLVVDDDPGIRALCSVALRDAGMDVLEAEDGKRGLEFALQGSPDVIVLDVRMPGLDGFELAELLRVEERTRRIPFLFLSGESAAANRIRALALGALEYMPKPFDPAAFTALVLSAVADDTTSPVLAD